MTATFLSKEKSCKDCGEMKPLQGGFYPHSGMADGFLNSCKECRKAYAASRVEPRRAARAKYEKWRSQQPDRKAKKVAYEMAHRRANPEKYKARMAVGNAVRGGKLLKPATCPCGSGGRPEAHHHDYSKPLDVEWMCFKCHREVGHGQVVLAP